MGYAHGKKWNDEEVIREIKKIVMFEGMMTFPTHSEIEKHENGKALCCAMARRGGTNKFAKILGLPIKPSESNYGEKYEMKCCEDIVNKIGLSCKKMQVKYAYDILVNDAVKIDVKASRLFHHKSGARFYTFNLEKKNQTCDIYICYCIDDNENECKVYIIPAVVLNGITQLSIGEFISKYDKYKYQWHYIMDYYLFMKNMQ